MAEIFNYSTPNWKPLERAVQLAGLNADVTGEFMWMCEQPEGIHQYKHRETRLYANFTGIEDSAFCRKALGHAIGLDEKPEPAAVAAAMQMRLAAQQAIDCQDACNLGGLVKSLDRIICDVLRPHPDCKGGRWISQHPIVFLFAYKIMALAGNEPLDMSEDNPYDKAVAACKRLVEEGAVVAV